MAPGPGIENTVPEELGKECALALLDEIYRGGTVDSAFQWLVILWMALGQKDVSTCTVSIFSRFISFKVFVLFHFSDLQLQIGPLSDYTINFLQHLKEFFGCTFKLEIFQGAGDAESSNDDDDEDDERPPGSQKVVLTCIGIGYSNISKKAM